MFLFRIVNKVNRLLDKSQKKHILWLAVLMMLAAFIEMASVSLVMPFMETMLNPESITESGFSAFLYTFMKFSSGKSFLVFMAFLLAALYVFKNLFLLFQLSRQNKFVYTGQFVLQRKLLLHFLNKEYEFFLSIDSGEVFRVMNLDAMNTFALVQHLMVFVSEAIVFAVIAVAVFIISPMITVSLAILLLVMGVLILKIIRPILRKAMLKQQKAASSMSKWLLQSIQGIKEIKIMKRERFFEDEFGKNGPIFVQTYRTMTTLSQISRFMIEGISMGAFFLVLGVIILKDLGEIESLIPILSVVAVAALRLLPSVNRLSQTLSQIATLEPCLDKVLETLNNDFESNQVDHLSASDRIDKLNGSIELKDVSYKYPTGEKYILSGANLLINKGESVGIVGPSGSGKTTAVDILLGLLNIESGKVLIDGKDIRTNLSGWLSLVGYIPQNIFLLNGTIKDNIAFGNEVDDVDDCKIWLALKEAALDEYVKTLPEGINTEIGERGVRLSGGQRQRIGIARALYNNPEILVFDEATSALDNDTEATIMESINRLKGKKTMIIIAHRLTTIEKCDVVYKVQDGKICKCV